ncbi:hypothetical protein [Streptomyces sp. WZ-12]|uniref:hypothetical protein n=1 Tax=Streptomyces sp. WZ-12 TaxID=3030210 RepID=UPI002380F9E5|nr:hypothetical protein [Streptomyces sp. WZ-12]
MLGPHEPQLPLQSRTPRYEGRDTEADRGEREDPLTTEEKEELAQLRREVKELRRANEILRTASAFFAGQLDPTRPR